MSPESSPTEQAVELMARAVAVSEEAVTDSDRRELARDLLAALLADPELLLSVLAEHGSVEWAEYVKVVRLTRDFETTPPRLDMTRQAAELLYRVVYRKAETE